MPRNGSGTYSLPPSSWNPAVSGGTIESTAANTTLADLASAMTQSLSKDGQTIPTNNLPMGGFKLTGLADGSGAADSMAFGQGAKLSGGNTFTGDQTINGSVSLSGALTVTGAVIFTSGTISIDNLTVTSVASVASLTVGRVSNLNILNVASVASLNVLNVASAVNVSGNYYLSSAQLFLTADATYYVRADGSDSNTGTANTAGGAWLTLQHAWAVISLIDLREHVVTVQVGDGTYTGALQAYGFLKGQLTADSVVFQGNSGTPTNVVVNATSPASGATIALDGGARVTLKNMQLKATAAGHALQLSAGSQCNFSGLDFGSAPGSHINVSQQGYASATGNYTISGGAARHWGAQFAGALIFASGRTVTISGTPAFSVAFASAAELADIACSSMTFTGSATGTRYTATLNGVINTNGGGANYIPGNVAGSTATGGQYA